MKKFYGDLPHQLPGIRPNPRSRPVIVEDTYDDEPYFSQGENNDLDVQGPVDGVPPLAPQAERRSNRTVVPNRRYLNEDLVVSCDTWV